MCEEISLYLNCKLNALVNVQGAIVAVHTIETSPFAIFQCDKCTTKCF